jgi:hypothetical protein
VAHACNPSYSKGRDQEEHGSKSAWQIVCETLSRKLFPKIVLVEWLKVKALISSPSTRKKKKNQNGFVCCYGLSPPKDPCVRRLVVRTF